MSINTRTKRTTDMATNRIVVTGTIITVVSDMKRLLLWSIAAGAIALAAPALAHDTPNLEHSHAFQSTAYGTWRQGHYVHGPQGSIIIWSPQPYTGYQNAPNVRFARPQPITRPPGSPVARTRADSNPSLEYGRKKDR